jgi:FAD:protein FMN transferase
MNNIQRILSAILVSIALSSCLDQDKAIVKKIQFAGEAQGTYYAVTYYAADTLVFQQQIDSLLTAFDQSASVWVPGSTISKINRNDPDVVLDPHFIDIFMQSKRIWKMTNGAFDITVGPLVNAWGFGFKNKIAVTEDIVDSLLRLVDFNGIYIRNNQIIKENPNIQIDYNAIAQGYSVDLAGGFLHSKGITDYLIDIGGEVLAKGTKPDGEKWIVGIERPAENADSERHLNATLPITNKAIATSGNYRKYYEENGIRYSHTIDPSTGYPAKNNLLSATILSDSASIADGYATALMVMGFEKSKIFLEQNPQFEAYLIYAEKNGGFGTWATEGLKKMMTEVGN